MYIAAPLIYVVLLLYAARPTDAAWYKQEHRYCDPTGTGWIPYTGFKLQRQYVFQDLRPPVVHLLSLSHCANGEVDFEQVQPVHRNVDIDWSKVYCVKTPRDDLSAAREFQNAFTAEGPLSEKLWRGIRAGGSKLTRGRIFQMSKQGKGSGNSDNSEDHSGVTEFSVRCYKLARRKKYVARNMALYVPYTFVGGVFECALEDPPEMTDGVFKVANVTCDENRSRAVLPLLADDMSRQSVTTKRFLTTITQSVPYLYTPDVLNWQFGIPGLNSVLRPEQSVAADWAAELNVNERYEFSPRELGLVNDLVTDTSNKLHGFLSISADTIPWEQRSSAEGGEAGDSDAGFFAKLTVALARVPSERALSFLRDVQRKWDEAEWNYEEEEEEEEDDD